MGSDMDDVQWSDGVNAVAGEWRWGMLTWGMGWEALRICVVDVG